MMEDFKPTMPCSKCGKTIPFSYMKSPYCSHCESEEEGTIKFSVRLYNTLWEPILEHNNINPGTYTLTLHDDGRSELEEVKKPTGFTFVSNGGKWKCQEYEELVEKLREFQTFLTEQKLIYETSAIPFVKGKTEGYFESLEMFEYKFEDYLAQPEPPQQWHDDWF